MHMLPPVAIDILRVVNRMKSSSPHCLGEADEGQGELQGANDRELSACWHSSSPHLSAMVPPHRLSQPAPDTSILRPSLLDG